MYFRRGTYVEAIANHLYQYRTGVRLMTDFRDRTFSYIPKFLHSHGSFAMALYVSRTVLILAAAISLLKLQEVTSRPGSQDPVPRDYALIVKVRSYSNLPSEQQLDYAERDAREIYS